MNKSKRDEFLNKCEMNDHAAEVYHPASYYSGMDKGYSAGFAEAQAQAKVLVEAINTSLKGCPSNESKCTCTKDVLFIALEQYKKVCDE